MITPTQGVSGVSSIDYVIGTSKTQIRSPLDRKDNIKGFYDVLAGLYIRSGKSVISLRIEDVVNNAYIRDEMSTLLGRERVSLMGPISNPWGYHFLVRIDEMLYIIRAYYNPPRINYLI